MSELSTNGQTVQQDVVDTSDTVMVAISGFTVLVWDHLVTFDDEVELIWKHDKKLLAYLFLINRYLTPLGFIVNLVAFTLPSWGLETFGIQIHCQHFVRYEGAMTVIGTQIAGFIMFLRVRAIYNQNKIVVWSLMALFLVWLGVNAWLLTSGQPVDHESGWHSCTMIFNPSNKGASASAWLPLLYDTCIFALTLYRTKCGTGHIIRTMWSDGILYYSVICMVNIVLTVMIALAGSGVKNITAQLELLLTVAMVSRITLNLRKQSLKDVISPEYDDRTFWGPRRAMRARTGSARISWFRSLRVALASTMPRRNSDGLRSKAVSRPEHVRLSTIYFAPTAIMTPATGSLVSEGGPIFHRPEIEQDFEAV